MWLLEGTTRNLIEKAEALGFTPSAAQQATFEARFNGGTPGARITSEKGIINISGVMTKEPSFLAMLFGGGNTTYAEIKDAIAMAEADSGVDEIVLLIDSPGGHIDGMFSAMDAIKGAAKPVRAEVVNIAASAAYGLASQADSITVQNRAGRVGSVGIAVKARVDKGVVAIASTNAPKKIPDVQTAEGVAIVVEELDGMHSLFAEAIADGRGVTSDIVNTKFGEGAMLLAENALSRGMIDAVGGAQTKPVAQSVGDNMEASTMDEKELLAKYPALHAQVGATARAEGIISGQAQERDRVNAHVIMGSSSGDMKTALAAIADGSGMTAVLQATYMAATANKGDVDNRSADDIAAALAADNANTDTDVDANASAVADIVEAGMA